MFAIVCVIVKKKNMVTFSCSFKVKLLDKELVSIKQKSQQWLYVLARDRNKRNIYQKPTVKHI